MKVYGLFRVITAGYSGDGHIMMSHTDVDILRKAANAKFANPENFVSQRSIQLIIPDGEMKSNVVGNDGGGQLVSVYIEIREVELPGIE